ncbi:MAG: hypothetical protein VXV71_00235, partial [Candidatus Thermoplasmatota archaeon]|nr:hypothetical protein [Candidatus Thermoplasmatota archaeon]
MGSSRVLIQAMMHWVVERVDANDKTGFPGDLNSLVRLRTANGGQLLIHDTAGIVYLINPKGTAWVEMSD